MLITVEKLADSRNEYFSRFEIRLRKRVLSDILEQFLVVHVRSFQRKVCGNYNSKNIAARINAEIVKRKTLKTRAIAFHRTPCYGVVSLSDFSRMGEYV